MSTPTSFRLPANLTGKAEPEVVEAIGYHDDSLVDLNQAVGSLKAQINALKAGTTSGTSTAATTSGTSASETVVIPPAAPTIGFVNLQTGNTAYTTQQSDYGGFLIFGNAAPVAVTLATVGITTPWYAWIANTAAGTVTLTPSTGTVNGGGSFALLQNQACGVAYDGTNFELILIPAPPSGLSVTIVTAKLTVGGANGSTTFTNGILTAQVAAT